MTLPPPMPEAPLPPAFLAGRVLDRFRADATLTLEATCAQIRAYASQATDEDAGRILDLLEQAIAVQTARDAARTRATLRDKVRPTGADALTAWYAVALGEPVPVPFDAPAPTPRPAAPTGPTPQQVAQEARTRAPVPAAPYALDALTDAYAPAPAQLVVVAADWAGAQRQLWRHVANRACLAILADARLPTGSPSLTVPYTTTPPDGPPRVLPGGDVYRVRVDPLSIAVAGRVITTPRMDFDLLVRPEGEGARVTLRTLRGWPAPKTPDTLFRYWAVRRQFVRRDGLSGDMVALFETLLAPYARTLLDALGS